MKTPENIWTIKRIPCRHQQQFESEIFLFWIIWTTHYLFYLTSLISFKEDCYCHGICLNVYGKYGCQENQFCPSSDVETSFGARGRRQWLGHKHVSSVVPKPLSSTVHQVCCSCAPWNQNKKTFLCNLYWVLWLSWQLKLDAASWGSLLCSNTARNLLLEVFKSLDFFYYLYLNILNFTF